MTTYLRIRRDGIPLHSHPTNRNPHGHWHGAWEQHHDMRDAHIVHDAAHPMFETSGRDTSHMTIDQAIRWGHLSQAQWEMYERSMNGEVLIQWYARKQERKAARNGTSPAPVIAASLYPDDWNLTLTQRPFGVEMECGVSSLPRLIAACALKGVIVADEMMNYVHTAPSTWKAMTDGSVRFSTGNVHPIEIVSPILQGEEGLRQLKIVCFALVEVGAKVNNTCGLHVHHDAGDIEVGTARRIAMNYHNGQAAIDKLVAPSRRGERQYLGPYDSADIRRIASATDIMDFPGNRYKNINIAPAYRLHHTFEIRQHQGTVEFNKVAAWVKLGQAIMDRGKAGVVVESGTANLAVFFAKMSLPMHLRQFFRERATKLKSITGAEGDQILNGADIVPPPIFTAEEELPEALTPEAPAIPSVFTRDSYGRIIPTIAGRSGIAPGAGTYLN